MVWDRLYGSRPAVLPFDVAAARGFAEWQGEDS